MTDVLAVIQADREEAANLQLYLGAGPKIVARIREGRGDYHPFVQAFARHRLDTRPTPAAVGDVEGLVRHFEKMQGMCSRYLEPGEYLDRVGQPCIGIGAMHAFISDMIYMLDGPEQREAQASAIAALAQPQPSGGVDEARALLLELTEISGDKAAAFTLREVGIVGTVFEQQAAAIQRALLGKGGQD